MSGTPSTSHLSGDGAKTRMMAIILAGGVGKRLDDVSQKISKAMLPILGVPITARIIEQIVAETPLRRFVIVAGKPDQDIVLWLRKNRPRGVEMTFVVQPAPRGMADALKRVAQEVGLESDFLVAACDNLFQEGAVSKLYDTYCGGHFDGAICLLRMEKEQIAGKSAAVYLDSGRIARIVEKPPLAEIETDLASIPLYIFSPRLTKYLPLVKPSRRGEYELQDAIQMLIDDGGNVGYSVTDWRRTVTSPEDLLALNLEMLRKGRGGRAVTIPGVEMEQPVVVDKGCVLREGCHIGPNVYVGAGCTVGRDCRLSNCVVLPGTTVPDGTQADNELLR